MDLPNLECLTYSNASQAEEECDGDFLMWGQFFNETTGSRQSAFIDLETEEERVAQVGPYYCSTCNNGTEGHGYVGNDRFLPDRVDDCSEIDCSSTQCPLKMFDTLEETGCANLQRYCESTGHGWLIYAKSFENYHGEVHCSGGCSLSSDFWGTEADFGEQTIAIPSHLADLRTWPMFFMWAMILFMFTTATFVDFRLFTGSPTEWFSHYLFSVLGYVDFEGNRNTLASQVCVNPCSCCCDCNCCCKKDTGRDASEMFASRLAFLSLLILSLGVALLFGDGESYAQICYFNALPPSSAEVPYNVSLPFAFHEVIFGQYGPVDVLDTDPDLRIFDREWFVSELAIILYEMAQELLAYNLVNAGYLTRKKALFVMLVNSTIFLLCCWSVVNQEEVVWSILWEHWLIGFIFAVILNPIFNFMAYGLAYEIAQCGCLPDPIKHQNDDEIDGKVNKSQITSDAKGVSQSQQMFKVAIPEGMEPGEQLMVHMGQVSDSSPLVTIPSREHWHAEQVVAPSGDISTQQFFYVQTPAVNGGSGSSSSSISMAGEIATKKLDGGGSSSLVSKANKTRSNPPSSLRSSGRQPSSGLDSLRSDASQGRGFPTNGAPVQYGGA